jgi:hypothetical protein
MFVLSNLYLNGKIFMSFGITVFSKEFNSRDF